MSDIKILWDPGGEELDSRGNKTYLRATDGDTPYVSMSIRMLSIDTPEVHYPGNQKPANQDANLAELAGWIDAGKAPINDDLAGYLKPRLVTGKAGTLQGEQGVAATQKFEELLAEKLTRPNGSKRRVYLHSSDESFDQYGRLLAYMSPYYSAKELAAMSYKDRPTFNTMMVESGWAAPFPIYPSLPKHRDLVVFQAAGKGAFEDKRGAWADPLTLTGYEFRMCVRLHQITKKLVKGQSLSSRDRYGWISRYCLDMTTREMFFPQDYHKVRVYNRVFVWPEDAVEAIASLNLIPAV
jgi:endonuclease YncB( thermonuclease family)